MMQGTELAVTRLIINYQAQTHFIVRMTELKTSFVLIRTHQLSTL